MKGIVDRIEDGIITLEVDENYLNFDLGLFPEKVKEGDIIEYQDGQFVILIDETKSKEQEIRNLFNSLLKEVKE